MEGAGHTAGFYRVGEGIWQKYADEGEAILCDSCMQSDPRYQADYPPPPKETPAVDDSTASGSDEELAVETGPAEGTAIKSLPSEMGEPDDDAADEDWPWEPAYLESLTTKKLRDLADRYGISMPSETVKKADLIELLLHSALPDDETE